MRELTTRSRLERAGRGDSTSQEILNRIETLELRLKEKYETERLHNGTFFKTADNRYFRIDCIAEYKCLVVEYGETKKAAEASQLEDGDLFHLDDLTDDELFAAVISEI